MVEAWVAQRMMVLMFINIMFINIMVIRLIVINSFLCWLIIVY